MKKISILASIAFAACASIVATAVTYVARAARETLRVVCAFAFDVVATIAGPADRTKAPAVRLVQAKAYVQRLIKRDRPVVTASWRMCPST